MSLAGVRRMGSLGRLQREGLGDQLGAEGRVESEEAAREDGVNTRFPARDVRRSEGGTKQSEHKARERPNRRD